MVLEIEEIKKILPHRAPFLLVDRIIEIDPFKSAVGIKNVTYNGTLIQNSSKWLVSGDNIEIEY